MSDIEYNYYIVAFIDLLGQKDSFKDNEYYIDEIYEGEELKKKLIKAHGVTVSFIEEFRESFEEYFKIYSLEGDVPKEIPEEKRKKFVEMRKSKVDLMTFSDCILISSALKPSGAFYAPIINNVFGIFGACAHLFLSSLSLGHPFRAGIEIGYGTKINGKEVYGPSFFRAYELESKVAKFSRILIGKQLMNFLYNLSIKNPQLNNQDSDDILWCKSFADKCLEMICADRDQVYILDYLGKNFISMFKRGAAIEALKATYKNALIFVEEELQRFRQGKNQELENRYLLLRQYLIENKP
ncbi:MAG: hypothetical protein AB1650_01535 [Candidatus Omnitrophota bacterium]